MIEDHQAISRGRSWCAPGPCLKCCSVVLQRTIIPNQHTNANEKDHVPAMIPRHRKGEGSTKSPRRKRGHAAAPPAGRSHTHLLTPSNRSITPSKSPLYTGISYRLALWLRAQLRSRSHVVPESLAHSQTSAVAFPFFALWVPVSAFVRRLSYLKHASQTGW